MGWEYIPTEWDYKFKTDTEPFNKEDPKDEVPYGWRLNLYLETYSLDSAIANWEHATNKTYKDTEYCRCCGSPYDIYQVYA